MLEAGFDTNDGWPVKANYQVQVSTTLISGIFPIFAV